MTNQDKNFSENEVKHLEMIQSVIMRMGQNSFIVKGLSITLVAGIYTMLDKSTCFSFTYITIVPILFLWFLDAYYLKKERQYRELYNMARLHKVNLFDMDISHIEGKSSGFWHCFFSKTEWFFYLILIVATILVQRQIVLYRMTIIE